MFKKTGILFLVLILPVFIYLGLKAFGTNHFSLPRYVPAIDSTTGEIKMSKRLNPRWNESEMDTVFQTIPSFSLTNETGKTFDSKSLKGKIFVASFFFTRCTTICPKITSQVSRVQDTFLGDPEVQLLSISVDPKFDQPEQLALYAKRFDANKDQWHFLTGEKKIIYPLVLKGFHVPLADASEYDAAIKNPDETFIHSERLVLVDKEGIIRGFYDGTDKKEVDRLLVEIKVLKNIYSTDASN
ncbi:SCO family protein [Aquirufa novilacunae]|jgi:protein SCO1/2|uniref:SCO family protein n=1 Tax=Aquirufa novilacunae TaxID=3139305 RepID=A0ABW8U304_9BACT